MKKDLVTVIIAAVVGFVAAYFMVNLFYPALEQVQIKTLGETVDSSVAMPSEDVFNFRSINPTVEVYVGQCKEYNANGDCIDSSAEAEEENDEENENPEESQVEESDGGDTN